MSSAIKQRDNMHPHTTEGPVFDSLDRTSAFLAHELRNPLAAIRLYSSLLRERLAEDRQSLDLIVAIDRSLNAMNQVVSNVMQFSSSRINELSYLNFHSVISEIALEFKPLLRAGDIQLQLTGAPFVVANENNIRQIIRNLLLNAVQSMDYHGSVTIAVRENEPASKEQRSRVRCEISDSGPGIAANMMPRLFQPFETSKKDGTGLGLAVVAHLLSREGGQYGAYNNENGAVFWFELNRSGGEDEQNSDN